MSGPQTAPVAPLSAACSTLSMRDAARMLLLKALCVLLMLASTASSYERSTSSPLFAQCRQSSGSIGEPSALAKQLVNDVADRNTARIIHLLNVLHREPGFTSSRLDEYRGIYTAFAQRTNCVAWPTLLKRADSHDEIMAIASQCLCSSIRNSIVAAVRAFYRCDLAAAAPGELPAVYLALGRRVNEFKRVSVHFHGRHPSVLKWHDVYVDKCFFECFDEMMDSATTNTQSRSANRKPSADGVPWFPLLLLVDTAAACGHYFIQHQLRQQRVLAPSPSLLVAAASCMDESIARTDGMLLRIRKLEGRGLYFSES